VQSTTSTNGSENNVLSEPVPWIQAPHLEKHPDRDRPSHEVDEFVQVDIS